MILQALVQYYEALAEKGELARPGWGPAKVSYALYLGEEGEIEQIVSVKREQVRKDKSQLVPREMILPAQVKRSSGVEANFLCDNAGYVLGVDGKGKKERTLACFEACKELHETILSEVDEPAARALLAYFRRWEPEKAMELAVHGMIPSNTIGRAAEARLRVYAGSEHKHKAQKPTAWEL